MNMREIMALSEAVKAYDRYRDQTVLIHRNPSASGLAALFKKFPGGLRGVITPDAFHVWDAELLHDDAIQQANITDTMEYLFLLPDVVQIKGEDFDERLADVRKVDAPLRAAFGGKVPYAQDSGEYM
jgi:hypothetical protein